MKKKPIDQFKNLIKECVREVVREELQVLTEVKQNITSKTKETLREELKNKFNPNIVDQTKTNDRLNYLDLPTTGDPLLDLLNETKESMGPDDYQSIGNFGSQNAQNFNYNGVGGEVPVGDTNDMLNSSTKSNNINNVNIDVVPDYSEMMGLMGLKK